jgi:DNA helicase-2/ATP-dependent DNA helicase PcrA
MTLHAAKGLEFPVVFIVGCENGLLPYERPVASTEIGQSTDKGADVEEERRLFYVGLTRARNKLVLTHARTRFLFGQRMQNLVSPFVDDIEAAFKEVQEMQRRPREEKPEEIQLSLF